MVSNSKTSHMNTVWATVFLTALTCWGLSVVSNLGNPALTPVAVTLIVGIVPALVSVPLLLASGEPSISACWIGRILVWVQALALLIAGIMTIVIMLVRS